tara:strand:- start:5259 stop:5921 length:663 start_codon:yes stop_codon:yes gene_type:complete
MIVSILLFPGTNCDIDTSNAVKKVLGVKPIIVSCKEDIIPSSDLIILPGGFSYGDYLRSGAIAAREPIMADLIKKAQEGTFIMGICNGFQILTEANLLPGTLLTNSSLRFISKLVSLEIQRNDNFFCNAFVKREKINIPIAHHDGNYFVDKTLLNQIEENNQVALRYSEPTNGSLNNIAGVYNDKFNILGLMPHPERAIDSDTGSDNGIKFFQSMLKHLN